ncbi:MAG: type II secretion system protein [Candidatus Aureabacteria bacterium]|nr:type II secretion system protein [Candidatus Auribacterota bacterium]
MNNKKIKLIEGFTPLGKAIGRVKGVFVNVRKQNSLTGFTIIETVAALAILVIAVVGILSLFPVGIEANKRADDLTTAAMLAQLKMTEILYDRPRSIFADGDTSATGHGLGPYICWNGSQYERIRWDVTGWTAGADITGDGNSDMPYYPFKNHPKFYWAAYRSILHYSLYYRQNPSAYNPANYVDSPVDAVYRIDLFVFQGDNKPSTWSELDDRVPAFYIFSDYVSLTNPM